MFGLFKKKKEEPKKQEPVQQPALDDAQVKREMAQHNVTTQMAKLEQGIDNLEERIEKINEQVKVYAAQKNKRRAMRELQKIKDITKQLESMENQRTVMSRVQVQLQNCDSNVEAAKALTSANAVLKDAEKHTEDLNDAIMDFKEYQQVQEQTQDMWADMAQTENEDVEKEYEELEAQMFQQQSIDQVPNVNINQTNVDKGEQIATKPQVQVQQQQIQKPAEQNMDNALDDMLN